VGRRPRRRMRWLQWRLPLRHLAVRLALYLLLNCCAVLTSLPEADADADKLPETDAVAELVPVSDAVLDADEVADCRWRQQGVREH